MKLLNYLMYYVTKAETKTDVTRRVEHIIQHEPNIRNVSFVQKVLMASHRRDYSAQETAQILLGLPYVMCSETFYTVNTSNAVQLDDEGTVSNHLQHYSERNGDAPIADM